MPRHRPKKTTLSFSLTRNGWASSNRTAFLAALVAMGEACLMLNRRSQQLLTRLRARLAAGQELADQFRPTDLEEWFAVSSTTAQDWLHQWQEQGLLEPARPGQRIRSWRLREPWQQWVLGQPQQRE
jgi:hypothetical protein